MNPRSVDPPPTYGSMKNGHLLIALAVRGPREAAERDDPGFAQDRKVLDRFVVDLLEAELLVPVGVIVQRDAVEAAAPRIAGRGAPVEPDGALRVQIRGLGCQGRAGLQACTRSRPMGSLPSPGCCDHWDSSRPPRSINRRRVGQNVSSARPVRLLEIEVRAIVFRRAHPKAVEGRLCRLAPAAEERQRAAAMEQTRGGELRFDALVAQDRIAAAHIEQVVRAHVMRVPDAEREAAARVRTLEERVPASAPR